MLTGILERTFGCREFYPGQYKAGNRYREMLKEVFKYIDQYYYNNITLKSAAEIANLSIAHFCRLFKASTGMTFKDYLALYRVNKAEELLYTSASITEICFSCGFNSMTSFNRAFKQFKHCTPSSYRNNL